MFNASAKEFIPAYIGHHADSNDYFFPYTISYPIPRELASSKPLLNVAEFLQKKTLFPDAESVISIDQVVDFFGRSLSLLTETNDFRGVFLSRSDLRVPENSASFSDAEGVLIPIEVDERQVNIIHFLYETVDACFSFFSELLSVTGFGYVRHNVFSHTVGKVGDTHFFYVTCLGKSEDEVLSKTKTFIKLSKMPFCRPFVVHSILPFVCSPQSTVSVVASVGEKKDFGNQVFSSTEIVYYPHDMKGTYNGLEDMEEEFFSCLRKKSITSTFSYFYIHVNVVKSSSDRCIVPIGDVFRFIGWMCNRALMFFLGVSFDSVNVAPDVERLLSSNTKESFFETKATDFPQHAVPINVADVTLGAIPVWITIPIDGSTIAAAVKCFSYFVENGRIEGRKEKFLTKHLARSAAQRFAETKFRVCTRPVGRRILVGTDERNKVFGIDVKSGSIFGLPFCFGGSPSIPSGSLFVATLTSFHFSLTEYRIIIEDVLMLENSDISRCPFFERWSYVNQIEIDGQDSWPQISCWNVVILRTEYLPTESVALLLQKETDYCSMGLRFICDNEVFESYVWIPLNSIRAKFVAEKIEKDDGMLKIFLSCLDESGKSITYFDEYTETSAVAFPGLKENQVVECILRLAEDGSHWWEIFNVADDSMPFSKQKVEELVHYGGFSEKELRVILEAGKYICSKCHTLIEDGKRDSSDNYVCAACWKATGLGDCVQCFQSLVVGTFDRTSDRFYCNNCRKEFSAINSTAEIGYHVPPSPQATFTQQVLSRCISNLIDFVNPRGPTDDVLELGCGKAIPRKWMRNKTKRYLGIDNNIERVRQQTAAVEHSSDLPEGASFQFHCGDMLSTQFWMEELSQLHPKQFQTVTCFSGFHNAFSDEEQCKIFIARIANALIPGGLFLGTFVDPNSIYQKGKGVANSVYVVEWGSQSVPRIGNSFKLGLEGASMKTMHVVPTDFLVAVAESYHLKAISEVWKSFREIIDNDPFWTKVPNQDEKDYLRGLRVFAFQKDNDVVLSSDHQR